MPDQPAATLEDRVTRLEELLERALAYGRKTTVGQAILVKLGLLDA